MGVILLLCNYHISIKSDYFILIKYVIIKNTLIIQDKKINVNDIDIKQQIWYNRKNGQ